MSQTYSVQATISGNSQAVNVGPRKSPTATTFDPRTNSQQIPAGGGVSYVFSVSNVTNPEEVFLAKDTGAAPQTFTASFFISGNPEPLKGGLREVGSLSWFDTPDLIPADTGSGYTLTRVVDNTVHDKMTLMVKDADNA